MSFIKKLIYNGQYPLTGVNKPEVCSFINDLTILYRQPEASDHPYSSYKIRCTDIILSKEYCLFSCTRDPDGKIFSASITRPVINTVYPLYSDKEYCGSISFSMIPSSVISGINMSDVFVNDSCILITTSDTAPIGGLEGVKQLVVTGSLKTTIESDSEKTTVYIYPNEELFTEAASNVDNSLGEDYGITAINGVKPDDKGRIGIVVTDYTCNYIPEIHKLTYITTQEITELCSNKQDAFSKIRCSAEDGEIISYPLDSFACDDTEHPVCAPVWDDQT